MTTGNPDDELHLSYSDDANEVWTCLNTTGQVLSIFEIASEIAMQPADVKTTLEFLTDERLAERHDNCAYSSLPGIVCEGDE